MPHDLEYIVTGALLKCSEGTVPTPFQGTSNLTNKVNGLAVTTELDKAPMVNIAPFGICMKLTKSAPVPCVPAPTMWKDTYPVKVKGGKTLLFKSCMNCGVGGKMEFVTSGQVPLPPDAQAELEAMQEETDEQLEAAKKEEESVGEAGFFESMIPIWGSGRDLIHAAQTGDGWGVALNAGFLLWDVASIAVGVVTFGGGTALMQAGKAAVKGGIKATAKRGGKALAKQAAKQLAKGKALAKNIGKSVDDFAKATGKVCVFACFPAGTPVATKDGLRPIEEIKMGDWVYAYNEETGETALRQVLGTVQREVDAIVEISLGEEKIRTTPEHPFYINGQWKTAGELEVGEMVTTMVQEQAIAGQAWEEKKPIEIKENSILVEGITYQTDKKEKVYNFEVEGWHTYFVGWLRVLVHNATACIKGAIKRVTKRLMYMGRTPGKKSRTGREVFDRMVEEGTARVRRGKKEFQASDGEWHPIEYADMSHREDAVSWWNRKGRNYGAKSKEVREWMLDPNNYKLDHRSINRSEGAKLGEVYLPPLK